MDGAHGDIAHAGQLARLGLPDAGSRYQIGYRTCLKAPPPSSRRAEDDRRGVARKPKPPFARTGSTQPNDGRDHQRIEVPGAVRLAFSLHSLATSPAISAVEDSPGRVASAIVRRHAGLASGLNSP